VANFKLRCGVHPSLDLVPLLELAPGLARWGCPLCEASRLAHLESKRQLAFPFQSAQPYLRQALDQLERQVPPPQSQPSPQPREPSSPDSDKE
jgi:hypothetical protein